MAWNFRTLIPIGLLHFHSPIALFGPNPTYPNSHYVSAISVTTSTSLALSSIATKPLNPRRRLAPSSATMLPENPLVSDICASAFSGVVAFSFLRLWEETAKRGLFDQVKPCFLRFSGNQYIYPRVPMFVCTYLALCFVGSTGFLLIFGVAIRGL